MSDDRIRRATEAAKVAVERAAEDAPYTLPMERSARRGEADTAEKRAATAFRSRFKEKTGLAIDKGEVGPKWDELFK